MIQTELPGVQLPENLADHASWWADLKGLGFEDAISKIANGLVSFGFKLLIAILVFYVGRFIIRKIYKGTLNVMVKRRIDQSLTTFVLSLIKMVLYFILIITIIGILGIETSSFLALFASAGVAIGMALSGTLQNFAGGVLILLLKPYKVGDYIETQGYSGTVKSIQLFHTVINTVDNKAIIIPNGGLSTGTINNFSLENYRRVDWSVGLSYSTDFAKAKEAILAMLAEDDRVIKQYIEDDKDYVEDKEDNKKSDLTDDLNHESILAKIKHIFIKRKEALHESLTEDVDMNAFIPQKVNRAPFVGLSEMGDSSITIAVRAWTHSSNYWPLFFEMNERFFTELPQKGLEFPFPQLDVHLDRD